MLLRRTVNEFISSSARDDDEIEILKRELHNDLADIFYSIKTEIDSLPRKYNKELSQLCIELLQNQAERMKQYEKHKAKRID